MEEIESTIADLESQIANSQEGIKLSPFKIGKNYLIRTVTMAQVGKLKFVGDNELVLSDASWIADTGRFHNSLKNGHFEEIEPFPNDVIVGRGAIVDATVWDFDLPREQK